MERERNALLISDALLSAETPRIWYRVLVSWWGLLLLSSLGLNCVAWNRRQSWLALPLPLARARRQQRQDRRGKRDMDDATGMVKHEILQNLMISNKILTENHRIPESWRECQLKNT